MSSTGSSRKPRDGVMTSERKATSNRGTRKRAPGLDPQFGRRHSRRKVRSLHVFWQSRLDPIYPSARRSRPRQLRLRAAAVNRSPESLPVR